MDGRRNEQAKNEDISLLKMCATLAANSGTFSHLVDIFFILLHQQEKLNAMRDQLEEGWQKKRAGQK